MRSPDDAVMLVAHPGAMRRRSVVAGTPGLLDDVVHLLDLPLGTAEGTEL